MWFWIEGLGFLGFVVKGLGFVVKGLGFVVKGLGFVVKGLGFVGWVWSFRVRV